MNEMSVPCGIIEKGLFGDRCLKQANCEHFGGPGGCLKKVTNADWKGWKVKKEIEPAKKRSPGRPKKDLDPGVSLLDRAKEKQIKKKEASSFTKNDEDLYLAWLKDEITISQADYAYQGASGTALRKFVLLARDLYKKGRLEIKG